MTDDPIPNTQYPFGYVVFNYESNKILKYSIKEQLNDVLPSALLAVFMGVVVYLISLFINLKPPFTLLIQIISGVTIVIFSGELLKINEYIFVKNTVLKKLNNIAK